MSHLKLVTMVVPKKTQVFVTNTLIPLSSECLNQLRAYPHIDLLTTSSNESEFPDITSLAVIVHFAGFSSPSLSDTLSYTTVLYRLLQLAKSYDSQLVLILPNSRNHLYHSAITMVTQFSKNFPLNYQIIEIDPKSNITDSAYEIVKKFIHRHPKPKIVVPEKKVTPILPPPIQNTNKAPHLAPKHLPVVLLSFFGLLLSPWLIYLLSLLVLSLSFACLDKALPSSQFSIAYRCSRSGSTSSGIMVTLDNFVPGSKFLSKRLGLPSSEVSAVFQTSTSVTQQLLDLQSTSSHYLSGVLTGTSKVESAAKAETLISELAESLAGFQTDIRSWYAATKYPSTNLTILAENLHTAKSLISKIQGLTEDWPLIFGMKSKQTYLVLIQDNTELRPSGGYIDSLLLLTLEDGKLTNTELLTSQAADSQLNGQVESPPDFKTLTGVSDWYLRDSNWDPDFPVTAKRAAWFATKELSRPINGVISINQKTLTEMLRILGSVRIDTKNLEVTSTNLTETYLTHLNSSSQSILYEVFAKIMDKLKSPDSRQLNSLLLSFAHQLESREIQIYPTTFSSLGLESAGWSGGVGLPGCRSQLTCLTNYMYATDTNIGVNKADHYMVKKFASDISITPTSISTVHSFDYQNTSTQSVWPAGDYKNYFRIYLPTTSILTSLKVNNIELPPSEYLLTTQNGLQLLGVILKVAAGESSNLVLTTNTPIALTTKSHFQIDIPNQPGLQSGFRKISLNYPESWYTTVYSSTTNQTPSVASPGLLRYNAPTSVPITLDIDLAPVN